jgi:hypothetical protein
MVTARTLTTRGRRRDGTFCRGHTRELLVSSRVNAWKAGISHLTAPVAVQAELFLLCLPIAALDLAASNGLCWVVAADAKRNNRT